MDSGNEDRLRKHSKRVSKTNVDATRYLFRIHSDYDCCTVAILCVYTVYAYTRYTKIRQEVNQSLAVAKSEKQKNDENTQKAKRKEEALTRERKDLAEEEKRLAELMVEMKKELENVKGRRTEAQREQQTAQTTQPTGSPGFLTTVGRLFRPSAFKSRLEMANEQLAEAQSDVFKAHDKVQELSAKIRRTQSKIIEHADNIRQIQDDKSKPFIFIRFHHIIVHRPLPSIEELSDQSGDLKRASEGLGKVIRKLLLPTLCLPGIKDSFL